MNTKIVPICLEILWARYKTGNDANARMIKENFFAAVQEAVEMNVAMQVMQGGNGADAADMRQLERELAAYQAEMPKANHAELVKHMREESFDCPLCAQAADYLDALAKHCARLTVGLEEAQRIVEAAKAWLIAYEDEVRDPAETAPCKELVAAIDALAAGKEKAG